MPGVLGRSPRTRRYYILLHGDPVRLLSMFKGSIHPLNISSLHVHGVPSPELSCLHVHRGFSRYSVSFGKPFGHGPFSLPSSGDGPGRRSLFLSPSVGSGFASHLRSDAVPPGSAAASLSFSSAVFSSAVHGSWPFFLFLRGLFSWREAVALPPGALPWFTECGLSSDRFGLGRGPPLCVCGVNTASFSFGEEASLAGQGARPPPP